MPDHNVVKAQERTAEACDVLTVRELRNTGWYAGWWVTSCCATEKEIYTLVKNFILLSIRKKKITFSTSFILQTLISSSCMFSRWTIKYPPLLPTPPRSVGLFPYFPSLERRLAGEHTVSIESVQRIKSGGNVAICISLSLCAPCSCRSLSAVDNGRSIPDSCRDISLRHRVQTGSAAHSAICTMGNVVCFSRGRLAGAWSWPFTFILCLGYECSTFLWYGA
jgi:hypothetical protein